MFVIPANAGIQKRRSHPREDGDPTIVIIIRAIDSASSGVRGSLDLLTSDNRVFGLDIGFETIQLCELKKSGRSVSVSGYIKEEIKERILDKDRIKNKAAVATLIKEACHNAKPHPKLLSSPERFRSPR